MTMTRRRTAGRRPALEAVAVPRFSYLDIRVGRTDPAPPETPAPAPPEPPAPAPPEVREAAWRSNAARLSHPAAMPPFYGPVGPLQPDYIGLCIDAALRSPSCIAVSRLGAGFFRQDRLPDGHNWRTEVRGDGTVLCEPWPTLPADPTPVPADDETPVPAAGPAAAAQVAADHRNRDRPLPRDRYWRLAARIAYYNNVKWDAPSHTAGAVEASLRDLAPAAAELARWLARHERAGKLGIRCKPEWEDQLRELLMAVRSKATLARDRLVNQAGPADLARHSRVTVKEVYDQLLAIERDFGPITVNWGKNRLGITTPPVVIRDHDVDRDVEFGPFLIAYNFTGLSEPVATSDDFTATALEPRQPKELPDESYAKCVHPHVHNESICLGNAVDALVTLLRGARLYEAFLIVRTVITVYSKGATPYLEPWRWLYTIAEKKNRFAAGRVAPVLPAAIDDDEGDEDDGGDEGEELDRCAGCGEYSCDCVCDFADEHRCPDCDNDEDECTCRQCANCDNSYDSADTGAHCGACDEDYCDNCAQCCDCSGCSRVRCNSCAEACGNCSNNHVCSHCRARCAGADCIMTVCRDCRSTCKGCARHYCDGCVDYCEHCGENLCQECCDTHGDRCDHCGDRKCGTIVAACSSCGEDVCRDCLTTPRWGMYAVCPRCVVACAGCGREFCAPEIVLDGLCPGCWCHQRERHDVQAQETALRADLGLGPDEPLLVGLFDELPGRAGPGAAALADRARAGAGPAPVHDHDNVRPAGVAARDVDHDQPGDRGGPPADGGGGPARPVAGGGDHPPAPPPAPAESGRRRALVLDAAGQLRERWVYGLPLFDIAAPAAAPEPAGAP